LTFLNPSSRAGSGQAIGFSHRSRRVGYQEPLLDLSNQGEEARIDLDVMQELHLIRGDGFSHAGLEAGVRAFVHHLQSPIAPLEEAQSEQKLSVFLEAGHPQLGNDDTGEPLPDNRHRPAPAALTAGEVHRDPAGLVSGGLADGSGGTASAHGRGDAAMTWT
jgi:hypothetical protein